MNFYSVEVRIIDKSEEFAAFLNPAHSADETRKDWSEFLCYFNQEISDKERTDYDKGNRLLIAAWKVQKDIMHVIAASEALDQDSQQITEQISKALPGSHIDVRITDEITLKQFQKCLATAEEIDNIRWDEKNLIEDYSGIDYNDSNRYDLSEQMIKDETWSRKEAGRQLEAILGDESFFEEMDRIYSQENVKTFYGNPVHYHMKVSTDDSLQDMAKLLASALYSAGRLFSRRINLVRDIKEYCIDDTYLKALFASAKGGMVIIDTKGYTRENDSYANGFTAVAEYIAKLIDKYQRDTLFVIAEYQSNSGFNGTLLTELSHHISLIEIKEGAADSMKKASEYLMKLARKDKVDKVSDCDFTGLLEEGINYSPGELKDKYRGWYLRTLKNDVYKAYRDTASISIQMKEDTTDSYEALKQMVGLDQIKEVVDEIISVARMKRLKKDCGLDSADGLSMHMVFTGNPGTAKTSVARMLAKILKQEDILRTGTFLECGRQDLCERFVGWTAKNVAGKFREASGGILFIDEAYSLVDDSHSYGDEAINTIVQEMENHRNDVIVIFAGYPDKMKAFLDQNEGLRSRIAFHLSFPDYNAGELFEIMQLMAKEKGLSISPDAEAACRDLFRNACRQANFGNGRYVRNTLEHAIMRQAKRISSITDREIDKDMLIQLVGSDFIETVPTVQMEKRKRYGFG